KKALDDDDDDDGVNGRIAWIQVQKDDRRIIERKKSTMERLPLDEEVVPKVNGVSLVDGVFDGAFGGDGEEDVVIEEGVAVTSSSLKMLTKSFLDRIMVSFIFLEGLEEKA
nr:hypothetical protein [Tanacetum cinerariifolium]